MNLFLLAAGEGTRFRPHTEKLPKPAIPFCGIPLINYPFFLTNEMKLNKLVINTFHLSHQIRRVGENLKRPGMNLYFSDEQPTLLGGGGGMAKAKLQLESEDGFLVINADEVIIPKSKNMMYDFYQYSKSSSNLSTLMVMKHPEAGKTISAVWVNGLGEVKGFGKTPPPQYDGLEPYHFIGPMYFKNEIFSFLKVEPSNILHDNLKQAIAMGERVGVFTTECQWFETGNLKDYLAATKSFLMLLNSDQYFFNEWKIQYLKDWDLISTSKGIILKHKSATINSLSNIEGFAVFGENCKTTSGVYFKNVVCSDNICINQAGHYQNELFL